jgi:threonine synthase
MGVVISLICPRCEAEYAPGPLFDGCPACRRAGLGVNLWPRYDEAAVGRTLNRDALAGRAWDMWRYGELLPVDPGRRVALGEGGTPLTVLPRLAARYDLSRLYVKDETRNATWSFKDRLAAIGVTHAVDVGAAVVLDASTGNQGAATAAHAAKAGVPAVVFSVGRVPWTMKVFMAAYGAMVLQIDDDHARRRMLEACVRELGWYPICNFSDPPVGGNLYAVEGYKTIAFEIAEQLQWQPPDVIVLPTDYGDAVARVSKGLGELRRLHGWSPRSASDHSARRWRAAWTTSPRCRPVRRWRSRSTPIPARSRPWMRFELPRARPSRCRRPRSSRPSLRPPGPKACLSSRRPPARWPVPGCCASRAGSDRTKQLSRSSHRWD